ncbi:hypothetical protein [Philodulcilactobacillus myokoensis]|uniref:hypothetical protein n=1 Tax=Philodulcilactobacillus myokoensis TaxID=2929573 RepID=UPI002570FD4A|nr:hypothetical protein [Philodulcilactobacillus myokoensis]
MSIKKYFITRTLSTGFLGGLILSFLLLLLLLISLHFGKLPKSILNNMISGAFSSIYPNHKILYSIIFIINSFIFGFVFSILGMVTTLFWNNKYAPTIVTLIVYLFSEPLLSIINLGSLGFTNLFLYSENNLTTPLKINLEFFTILVLSIIVGYLKMKRLLKIND